MEEGNKYPVVKISLNVEELETMRRALDYAAFGCVQNKPTPGDALTIFTKIEPKLKAARARWNEAYERQMKRG